MSDYNDLCKLKSHKLSTVIQQYPSGRFGLVGSMPAELCEKRTNSIGQEYHTSKTFDTEQSVIDALLNIGITNFQLANCKWYRPVV